MIETELRTLLGTGQVDRATDVALRAYGPELIGWLCAMLASDADAYDAFSWLSEMLWKSLVRFEGRCSVRTWCYMLGRQAVSRVRARGSEQNEEPISRVSSLDVTVGHVWNTTRREQARLDDVYTEIRKTLEPEDEMLLVLRVDRDLPWRDIAIVLLGEGAAEADVTRRAAAARKQFERIKIHLRALASERIAD